MLCFVHVGEPRYQREDQRVDEAGTSANGGQEVGVRKREPQKNHTAAQDLRKDNTLSVTNLAGSIRIGYQRMGTIP